MHLPVLKIGDNALNSTYKNERIILVVHHHWWNLLKEVFGVICLLVAPIILIPIASIFIGQSGVDTSKIGAAVGFFGAVWVLVCWQFLFVRWTDFYFDVWIITNRRIIDMDLKGLFNVEIGSMLDHDHIQEIGTHSVGLIQNLLNFGDILVQTAATKRSEFRFFEVSNPRHIENVIRSAQMEYQGLKDINPGL
jgi:hypothetical protein